MEKKDVTKTNIEKQERIFTRSKEDLDLKSKIISAPELFIAEKGSDEYLDKLAVKIKLIGGDEFSLSDYVGDVMAKYASKFSKTWYYRLADLYRVDRTVMDKYVKPEFVRQFTIQFVYARFPYKILRALRSRNRKTSTECDRTKLFQHLTATASEQLDLVIEQVYEIMGNSSSPLDFKIKYSSKYQIHFQTCLFEEV